MKLIVTGTPGTGKTTIANELGQKFDIKVYGLNEILEEESVGKVEGQEREVDIGNLDKEFLNLPKNGEWILEGHLAHHIQADFCVVLRCKPEKLKKRLDKRDYSESKVKDNVESEALDTILLEAIEAQDRVIEVENCGRDVDEVADEIISKIEEGKEDYGSIDYTEYL